MSLVSAVVYRTDVSSPFRFVAPSQHVLGFRQSNVTKHTHTQVALAQIFRKFYQRFGESINTEYFPENWAATRYFEGCFVIAKYSTF